PDRLVDGSREVEKRTIGLLHEFLSLTLWKKASIMKLGHFRREFGLPDKLNVLLLKHPGIFYEGLHEYNRRHHILNLEKRRKKGMIAMKEAKKDPIHELSDDEEGRGDNLGGIFDPEQRKRFYKVLFDDKPP
nr:hypothetical protein [Tanacetum cinerariifolium]